MTLANQHVRRVVHERTKHNVELLGAKRRNAAAPIQRQKFSSHCLLGSQIDKTAGISFLYEAEEGRSDAQQMTQGVQAAWMLSTQTDTYTPSAISIYEAEDFGRAAIYLSTQPWRRQW